MRDLAPSRLMASIALAVAALLVIATTARSQSAAKSDQDVGLGVWKVDLAKSRYYPGPPPISETRTFTRDKDGVKGIVLRRNADGREERIEYRTNFDQEYPVSGTEAYDAVKF